MPGTSLGDLTAQVPKLDKLDFDWSFQVQRHCDKIYILHSEVIVKFDFFHSRPASQRPRHFPMFINYSPAAASNTNATSGDPPITTAITTYNPITQFPATKAVPLVILILQRYISLLSSIYEITQLVYSPLIVYYVSSAFNRCLQNVFSEGAW